MSQKKPAAAISTCHIAVWLAVIFIASPSCRKNSNVGPVKSPAPLAAEPSPPKDSSQTIDPLPGNITEEAFWAMETRKQLELIREIGLNKSAEAIPFLVENLFKFSPVISTNLVDFSQTFPCSSALVGIGQPAVAAVITKFDQRPPRHEELVWLSVLIQIKGVEGTAKLLETRIESSTDQEYTDHLRSRLTYVRAHR